MGNIRDIPNNWDVFMGAFNDAGVTNGVDMDDVIEGTSNDGGVTNGVDMDDVIEGTSNDGGVTNGVDMDDVIEGTSNEGGVTNGVDMDDVIEGTSNDGRVTNEVDMDDAREGTSNDGGVTNGVDMDDAREGTSNDAGVTNGVDIDEFNKLEFLNVLELQMRGPISLPIGAQFVENLDKFQVIVGEKDVELQPSQRALMISKFDVSQELKKDNCLKALLKKADFLALKSATVKNIVPELDKEGYRDLSRLELSKIDSISRICEGKAPTELFYNLCHFEVSKLEKLEELFPVNPLPKKLITLKISDCNSLTYIFSEDGSNIIELPCLKTLALDKVSNLISVVKGSSNDDGRHPSFFNSKVTLTSLEELSLRNNKRIVQLWDKDSNLHSFRNLKVLRITSCEEMETIGPPSMFLSLVQLESLSIAACKNMKQVISDASGAQEISNEVITFPKLKYLQISEMENLECFYSGSYKMAAFPRLETLNLSSLKRMTKFAEGIMSSTAFFPKTVTFTSLTKLSLVYNKMIVKLWDKESNLHGFQNLKVLDIHGCDEMETIGPLSMFLSLVQLEDLSIKYCKKIQQVISDISETQEIPKQVVTFPKLKVLWISDSENLECFYGGTYKMAFPSLQEMRLSYLKRMRKFAGAERSTTLFPKTIEFPCLESVDLVKLSDEVRVLWDLHEAGEGQEISFNPLPKLRELAMEGEFKLTSIVFPSLSFILLDLEVGDGEFLFSSSSENEGCLGTYSQFPKLEKLYIQNCPDSVQQFVNDKDDCGEAILKFCGQLRDLTLRNALNLEVTSLHPFTSLRQVVIYDRRWEYIFSADGGFESLEKLTIQDCPNLEVIFRGSGKDSTVVFEGEPNQFVELPSLEELTIDYCDAIKSLSTRPLKAPKLRELTISNCPGMEWFLLGNSNCNADLELPSLEKVTIKKCPNIKSFSPALLRAPKLQLLTVDHSDYPIAEIEDFNHVLRIANIGNMEYRSDSSDW